MAITINLSCYFFFGCGSRLVLLRESFLTWSKESQVEDEAEQDDPGVGCWTVVVGPDGASRSLCLVGAPGRSEKRIKIRKEDQKRDAKQVF